jgi:hypothetical protein
VYASASVPREEPCSTLPVAVNESCIATLTLRLRLKLGSLRRY